MDKKKDWRGQGKIKKRKHEKKLKNTRAKNLELAKRNTLETDDSQSLLTVGGKKRFKKK